MAKAVIVKIAKELLEQALGLKWQNLTIESAQISHSSWQTECLELVVSGESLDDAFTVTKGEKVKVGVIMVHHKEVETEIRLSEV